MRYLFSCILALILSAVFVCPSVATSHKHNINKELLKVIKKARSTGLYGDLTDRPANCDSPDRDSGQVTQIIIHSTHVIPSNSFNEVIAHSLTTRAFTHYYIDRDGTVIQRLDDLLVARHTRSIH